MRVPAPKYWFLLVLIYFGLHALLRIAMGEPLTETEARLLEDASTFRWSYDGQPPLYNWIQFAVFQFIGPGLPALAFVKNGILVVLVFAVYCMVRPATGLKWAWVAVLSLFLLPNLVWTAQHDLSADLLATALAALTVMALVLARRDPSFPRYLMFGAFLGLGTLSAPSFLVFAASLLAASLTIPGYRRMYLSAGMSTALLIAIGIAILPGGLSGETGMAGAALAKGAGSLSDRASSALATLSASVQFAALLIAALVFAFSTGLGKIRDIDASVREIRRLLARTAAGGFALFLIHALNTGTVVTSQASLLPVLFLAAPALALFLYPLLKTDAQRVLPQAAALAALVLLVASPVALSFRSADAGVETVAAALPPTTSVPDFARN